MLFMFNRQNIPEVGLRQHHPQNESKFEYLHQNL